MRSEKPGIRTIYMIRFVGRCAILAVCLWAFIFHRDAFDIVQGWNFFRGFSPFHLLWGIWMIDMLLQLIPTRGYFALGSQKVFRTHFRSVVKKIDRESLKKYIRETTASAYRVMLLWAALIAAIGLLHWRGVLCDASLLLISTIFYVCDLICVLFWCPFRVWIMKNRCCTTCRIFNWDHLMMFSPLAFVKGFFPLSLFFFSLVIWCVWELCVLLYPERFWESSNQSLKCAECTDLLCGQHCRKLR